MNTLTDEQRDRILALLRQGKSLRRIELETGHRRETIAAYGRRAGLIGDAVVVPFLAERTETARCEPYRDLIRERLEAGEPLRRVHADLVEQHGFPASYSTLKRYVRARFSAGTVLSLAA